MIKVVQMVLSATVEMVKDSGMIVGKRLNARGVPAIIISVAILLNSGGLIVALWG